MLTSFLALISGTCSCIGMCSLFALALVPVLAVDIQVILVEPPPQVFIATEKVQVVQLLAVVIHQAGPAQNMFVYVARRHFLKEVGHFRRIFYREGTSPTNQC